MQGPAQILVSVLLWKRRVVLLNYNFNSYGG
nr:MAG TPA: hypothetical protein [Bacteriophage sp.]